MSDLRSLELTPFGIEVLDYDLNDEHTDANVSQLRHLWLSHGVMLFRSQTVSEEALVRFSRHFGPLERHVREEYLSRTHPEILLVSNIKDGQRNVGILGDHEVGWHHDQIYLPRPALGSVLAAHTLPSNGGNTAFVNLADAYDGLDDATKRELAPLRAVHSYAHFNKQWSEPTSASQKARTPDVDHPLIRTHPETGRQAIYADPGMTVGIVGMEPSDSRTLLDSLFSHSLRPEYLYEHKWRAGDVVMWDNASTMHKRGEFDPASERLMKRTTILPAPQLAVPA